MRASSSTPGNTNEVHSPHPTFEDYRRERIRTLRSLPLPVARDIIQNEPRDSYRHVQAERDRRMRMLIRRYENQIQYGCHNRSCTTPSCLSYRRRNSKTPLRPYTDTSARALACHLVEESARGRKDPADGLCPNSPVVPWYQDSRRGHTRKRSSDEPGSSASANGHPENDSGKRLSTTSHPVRSRSGRSSVSGEEISKRSFGTLKPPSSSTVLQSLDGVTANRSTGTPSSQPSVKPPIPQHNANPAIVSRERERILAHQYVEGRLEYLVVWREEGKTKMDWTPEEGILDRDILVKYQSDNFHRDVLGRKEIDMLEATLAANGVVRLSVEARPTDHENRTSPGLQQEGEKAKVDDASFTQALHNTIALKDVEAPVDDDKRQSGNSAPQMAEFAEADYGNDAADFEFPETSHDYKVRSNTAFCGLTLRRLSWYNLLWLHDNHQAMEGDVESPTFVDFVKRSIYYCFSNPNRLIESAQTWQIEDIDDIEALIARTENATEPSLIRVSKHTDPAVSRPSLSQGVIFDVDATIEAFEMVAESSHGTNMIFDALHDTIQQCYNVDHPSYMGDKAAAQARKAFKGMGGGLRDPSGTAVARAGNVALPDREQISQIMALVVIALVAPPFDHRWADAGLDPILFLSIAEVRNDNKASFNIQHTQDRDEEDSNIVQTIVDVLDHLQDWHRERLITALTDCISHHVAAMEIRRHKSSFRLKPRNISNDTLDIICKSLETPTDLSMAGVKFVTMIGLGIIDIGRTVLLTQWDRDPVIAKTSSVGGALELLSALYHRLDDFKLGRHLCAMQFIANAFDEMDFPTQWLNFEPNSRQTHILAYPFLFETATLVKYFRAINVSAMRKSFELAAMVLSDANQFLHNSNIPLYGAEQILDTMRPYMAKFFVLTISRENVLEDAMNQLWRRQKREILRPLRVRLGKDEGEDGLDHGGVQQEFFRLIFAEAFDPKYGMFQTDSSTHMTWFQPGSLEPTWKYEALGIFMSLAIYNAVTLPITMPIAFYRKILGFKVKKLEHIKDGWPALERGLRQLLAYDGDVAEDIGRTYEFSYAFGGVTHSIDMTRQRPSFQPIPSRKGKEKARTPAFTPPQSLSLDIANPAPSATASPELATSTSDTSSPILDPLGSGPAVSTPLSTPSPTHSRSPSINLSTAEASLVTNDNREAYVRDYIMHLTHKSIAPQFTAFVAGLHTCVSPRAVSLFAPEQLRDLIEGHRSINVTELQESAAYDDYRASESYIRGFWDVVREETAKDEAFAKALLEFVTASERVPVGGLRQGGFVIQRNGHEILDQGERREDGKWKGGDRDEEGGWKARLPSSSTCYGRLLLPRYVVVGEEEGADNDEEEGREGAGGMLWKEVLRERLCKAVSEGRGFGML